MSPADGVLEELRAIAGPDHVLTDPDLRAPYERDWTGRFGGLAWAVVRPGSSAEVCDVVRTCAGRGVRVVPQGGNTGLVGGGVPRGGEVVLSLARLRTIGAVDRGLGQVAVGAGVTLAQLQDTAARAGLDAGLDFAARDSATVGGIVACDAGGARALRHGTARARVAGMEAVLADGSTLRRMSGLAKDNAGTDVSQLLIGSEGTLAVITAVLWRLVPRLPKRVAALVPLPDPDAAAGVLAALVAHAPSLEACELMTREGMELVLAHQRRSAPVPAAELYLLVELAARHDPTEELAAAFAAAGVEHAAIADDSASRARLWTLREGHPDAIAATGVAHKLDVGVPLRALPAFLREVPGVVRRAAPGARPIVFGHLGDGNLHVNVLGVAPDDPRADDAVLQLTLDHGGTISAEHGVGTAKAAWLRRALPPEELALMRRIKAALDPHDILNVGAVLEQAAA